MTAENQVSTEAVDQQTTQKQPETGNQTEAKEGQSEKSLSDALYPADGGKQGETASETEKNPEGESPKDDKEAPTPDEKPEADKGDEVDYADLKLPEENSFLDDKDVEKIAAIAKEQGFSLGQAQKILDLQNEKVSAYRDKLLADVDERSQKDYEKLIKDPDIGGDNFEETKKHYNLVIDKFADDDFKNFLIDAGVDNNPVVVKFLSKIGAQFGNDELITTSMHTPPKEKTFAERMYPTKN